MNRKIKTSDHLLKQGLRVLLLVFALLSTSSTLAYDFEIDGICYYVHGSEATVATCRNDLRSIIIPSIVTYGEVNYSVTSIASCAFIGCSVLANITIPNSVTSIGEGAFNGTSWYNHQPNGLVYAGLVAYKYKGTMPAGTNISLREGTCSISPEAFSSCYGLTNITIPNSVKTIGASAFNGTSWYDNQPNGLVYAGLVAYKYKGAMPTGTIISLREGTCSISPEAFSGCDRMISITIPNSVKTIGNSAFENCSCLTNITIPNSVIAINTNTFLNCSSLTDVIVPESINTIGKSAFNGCTGLTSINFPNSSVTSIGQSAFSGCTGLTHITIPESVNTIGESAFYGCTGLTSVNFPNSSVTSIGRSAFHGCTSLTHITIPESVNTIGESAFYGCTGLTSVNFSNSSATSIGQSAFSGCTGLTSVNFPNSSVTSIGQSAFSGCTGLTSITIPESVTAIGDYAFTGSALKTLNFNAVSCTNFTSSSPFRDLDLSTINIGNHVQRIPAYFASYLSKLTNIIIPESVTAIGDYAFCSCKGLTSVSISNSVTSIGKYTFDGCIGLTSISIPNSITTIGESAFNYCPGLTSVNITDIAAWCRIAFISKTSNPLYQAHHLYLNGSELTNLVIPNSVSSISSFAFYECTGLTSVTFLSSVTSINYSAFAYCNNLLYVKLPKTLKSIGESAFYGCNRLTGINIPESVTSIGRSAFYDCTGLTNVSIPNSVTTIGNSSFTNCKGLKNVTITSHLTSIGESAFTSCSALSAITCMSETPPFLDNSNSFNTYGTTSLFVPRSGIENYKTHTNWRRFTKIYEFVGYFTVPDVNVSKDKTVVVPVSLTNEADIIGFQTDIYLPEGFEFVKDGNDYVVDPSNRMARDHSIMCNISDDGTLRVLCFSPTNKVISGNEGELFYVTIKAPADTVGDFSLCFKNTILTTSDADELLSPDAYTNINVIPYLPGDANGNGEVSVIDIVTAAQYIIFQDPDPFLFEAADLNNDEQITVTDLALIANLILYSSMNAPKRVPSIDISEDHIHGNDIQLNVGETRTVTISLDDVEEYSAFQMDVKMPRGLTATNFKMVNPSSRHSFITSEEKNGIIRVLCYSPVVAELDNNEKTLLTFDVTATDYTGGDIIIDGIELVTTTCLPVHLDALAISVNQSTTINEISTGKRVAHIDYYHLSGQKQMELKKGVTIVVTTYTDGSCSAQKVIF